jgi:hypothetical protein
VERDLDAERAHHVHDDRGSAIFIGAPAPPAQIDRADPGGGDPLRVLFEHPRIA